MTAGALPWRPQAGSSEECAAARPGPASRRWPTLPALDARSFNRLSFDVEAGIVTKESQHTATLIDEIRYLHALPDDLAIFFPRVLASSTDPQHPFLELEYYPYPTLSRLFCDGEADAALWEAVFDRLQRVLAGRFMRHRGVRPEGALQAMYLDKTRRRVEAVGEGAPLADLLHRRRELRVNGRAVPSLGASWALLEDWVAEMERDAPWTAIHGDLGFGNILFDPGSGLFRLIDPRGRFRDPGIYGDPHYDVAKLYHSLVGSYELIVHDRFAVAAADGRIDVDCVPRGGQREVLERFEAVFFAPFDRRRVTLITALLFLSMLPLHEDAPRRQLAMLGRGLELLADGLAC